MVPIEEQVTLKVTKVPDHMLKFARLSSHFARFGEVVNIQLRRERKTALVEFADHKSAEAAFKSPRSVLNNRFIRVKHTTLATTRECTAL